MRCFLGFLSCLISMTAAAQAIHSPLLNGDKAYAKEQYKTAEKHYRIAADRDNGNPKAVYNLGNSLYQQGNFEDAGARFNQAANATQKPEQTADALHNLGNAYLNQRKYKEAVQAYQGSLRLRAGDPETKMNLQMAQKKLKEEQQKEKDKQQQNQQQQNQNQDPNQSKQDPQNPSDPKQNQSPPPQDDSKGQPQTPPSEQQKQQAAQKLKKDDAKRLLETAIGPDDRKNARKYRAAQQQSKPKSDSKDW